jgi:hypothetical protein
MRNIAVETLVTTNDETAVTTRREIAVAASLINQSYTRPAQCVVIRKTSGGTTMKTLYALAAVCMSLHAFTASAETPALMVDDYPSYFSAIDDIDAREELAARDTTLDADVATDPATDNSFAINPDADDYTAAEVIPGINAIPQSDEDLTGSFAEPGTDETE